MEHRSTVATLAVLSAFCFVAAQGVAAQEVTTSTTTIGHGISLFRVGASRRIGAIGNSDGEIEVRFGRWL